MTTVSVRYITDDVDAAVAFYVERLGFRVEMRAGPGFAMLSRGDLRLLLNRPGAGSAGQPMPDGRRPEPGGWNRIQIEVSDLEREVAALRAAGASFRGEIVAGRGGRQVLLDDPAGNPVELFQPAGA
jgi:catechol 2,3-dioxygenase-like lactoylglutathione lyase family enzyme